MTLRPTGWIDGHTLPAQLRELIGCTGAGSPLGCTIVKDTKARHSEVTLGCPGPGFTPVRVLAAWGGGVPDWGMGRIPAQRPPSLRQCLRPRTEASESELPLFSAGSQRPPQQAEELCQPSTGLSAPALESPERARWGQTRGQWGWQEDPSAVPHPEPCRDEPPLGWGPRTGPAPGEAAGSP